MGASISGQGVLLHDSISLTNETLPAPPIDLEQRVPPDQIVLTDSLAERLGHIRRTTGNALAPLLLSVDADGVKKTFMIGDQVDSPDSGKRGSVVSISTNADGLTADSLAVSPISVPVGSFAQAHVSAIASGQQYQLDVPLDARFRSETVEGALISKGVYADQRVIIANNDMYLSSALLIGVSQNDEGKVFRFRGDAGNVFSLREHEIIEIYRAGKNTVLLNGNSGANSSQVPEGAVPILFSPDTLRDYLALHQTVEVGYEFREKGERKVGQVTFEYLGIQTVEGERTASTREEIVIFGLTKGPYPQLFAIRESDVRYIAPQVDNDSPKGGRSPSPGLGQIPAYRCGKAIFKRDQGTVE